MRKKGNKRTRLLAVLLILVLLISVGYAALTTTLNINGTATLKKQSWSVYFDNYQPTQGSVTPTVAPTITGTTTTEISWTVSMDTPGQFYEFNIDVVNGGTIDAMIGNLSNTTLTTEQAKYLTYTVTYDDDSSIEQYDTLVANSTDTLKVRLAFKTDLDPEDLPGTAQQVTLTYTSNYVQADNNAKPRTVAALTVQQLAQAGTIKVGDYVNYTPSSGTVTVTSEQTGADNDQTFSTANDTGMTWRVLSVDSNTGEVQIVGTPTTRSLELYGKAGFGNAETVLNSIASIYGGGTGAASARSITEDDIFDAIGYNKIANYSGESYTYESGEWFTENWNGTTATYSTTTTIATEENPITLHNTSHNMFDSNNEWVGGGINVASQTLENGTADEKAAMQIYWDMLIGGNYEDIANEDYTGCLNYWCASRYVMTFDYGADFYIRGIGHGGFGYGGYSLMYCGRVGGNYGQYEKKSTHALIPVVALQFDIGMEQENNVWNFVQ